MPERARFFRDGKHRSQVFSHLKLMACPHCRRANALIRNGLLRGNNPAAQRNESVIRGQRIRCSNRNQRQGCGRSFSMFEARTLPGFSVDARLLWAYLEALLEKASVHTAAQGILRYFSLSSAYRWHRRLIGLQTDVRHRLCQLTKAPASLSSNPLDQLIAHLRDAFPGKVSPVEAFQARLGRYFYAA